MNFCYLFPIDISIVIERERIFYLYFDLNEIVRKNTLETLSEMNGECTHQIDNQTQFK